MEVTAELPAAARAVATSTGAEHRRRARSASLLGARAARAAARSSAGRRCASAGSSRSSAGGLALLRAVADRRCCSRRRCRSALRPGAGRGCATAGRRCARRTRRGQPWVDALAAAPAGAAPLSPAAELLAIVLGLLAPCLVAFTIVARRAGGAWCWWPARAVARLRRDHPVDGAELRPAARAGLADAADAAGARRRPPSRWRCCLAAAARRRRRRR